MKRRASLIGAPMVLGVIRRGDAATLVVSKTGTGILLPMATDA